MTTEQLYDDEPTQDKLDQLLSILKDTRVSPLDLYAYALALDAQEEAKEELKEDQDPGEWTTVDSLEADIECQRDDRHFNQPELFRAIELARKFEL